MKFLFIVQGEGRGHMTQAIALSQKLESWGHTVSAVCIGKSARRQIPAFVHQNIAAPIYLYDSPNFVTDEKQKSILLWKTFTYNLGQINKYQKSLRIIDEQVNKYQPDVILNFYDILGGLYKLLYKHTGEFWTIGHQYLIEHPEFPFAPNQTLAKWLFKLNTNLTAIGASKKLALSFRNFTSSSNKNLYILPPLLRREVKDLQPKNDDFFLCYMVNPGYGQDVINFATANPNIEIVAFWDHKSMPDGYKPVPNLIFHQVNDRLFLEKMASCKGLVSTAGFESICEAMYMGKPVMMVPVAGQYEQACNAMDAEISGAGIQSTDFDFRKLIEYIDQKATEALDSKTWFDQFDSLFLKIIAENDKPPLNSSSVRRVKKSKAFGILSS
ncbi:hypothetical protein C943_00258 [Mariniradius saccharolyticus AK6]|uniref:Glycosyltransferase n=1 Tax=Mariniradius saccharolyticus AK6 TaxID=1239962 RepID=M7Y6X8_9BACT|nr:glycosyltransferase family protein [Mariniradius saccharolyticus]EMS32981.1 hypothetical protein C943_00258 [Mariniradius saccharolyticus AK6]